MRGESDPRGGVWVSDGRGGGGSKKQGNKENLCWFWLCDFFPTYIYISLM